MTQRRERRRGEVFSVRLTPDERAELDAARARGGPRSVGAWMRWAALEHARGAAVLPARAQQTELAIAAAVLPGPAPSSGRTILDLCGGSGAWSAPYAAAGYDVELVTLPRDVRTLAVEPDRVIHGVLAAPPCDQFSLARNGHPKPRDIRAGLEVVAACLRIIAAVTPVWWALENPVGLLSAYLGTPRDTWEPCDFGDPWTKRTAIWGDYAIPKRGPFAVPLGGGPLCELCDPEKRKTTWCNVAAHRAVTPPGFARAFFDANP